MPGKISSFAYLNPSLTTHFHSDMRQVPDMQEVFLSHDSDTSMVVEILAVAEQDGANEDLREAIKWVGRWRLLSMVAS
jgi:hypothetical protein